MRNKIIITVILAVFLFVSYATIAENNSKNYVYFNNEYYWVSGASVSEENIIDTVGIIERRIFRSFLNKNYDSNFVEPGAKICIDKNNQLCIEMLNQSDEENISNNIYLLLIKE